MIIFTMSKQQRTSAESKGVNRLILLHHRLQIHILSFVLTDEPFEFNLQKDYSEIEQLEKFSWANTTIICDFINICLVTDKSWSKIYQKIASYLRFRAKMMYYAQKYFDINAIMNYVFQIKPLKSWETEPSVLCNDLRYVIVDDIDVFDVVNVCTLIHNEHKIPVYFGRTDNSILQWQQIRYCDGCANHKYFGVSIVGNGEILDEPAKFDMEFRGKFEEIPLHGRYIVFDADFIYILDNKHVTKIEITISKSHSQEDTEIIISVFGCVNSKKTIQRCIEGVKLLPNEYGERN
jgi:hypothetical protein